MKKITLLILLLFVFIALAVQIEKNAPSMSQLKKVLQSNYGFVPSGKVLINENDKDTISVQSFIIGVKEVTNFEYREFLADLKSNGSLKAYEIAQIDSANWSDKKGSNSKYVQYYHTHPAYREFPVVNISKEAAHLYCEWLTEKFNRNVPDEHKIIFRLPTKAEWLRAACGDNFDKVYAWNGPYLRNSKGEILANFVRVGENSISRNEQQQFVVVNDQTTVDISAFEDQTSDVTAASKSYWPNEFGLYNMNGNVAEMLSDGDEVIGGSWFDTGYDIRNRSVKRYNGSNTTTGFRVVATLKSSDFWNFKKNSLKK